MYLARYLLIKQGFEVIGIVRRTSLPTTERLASLRASPCFHLVDGDVTDLASLTDIVGSFKPDHFYHLAGQSHVGKSWQYPIATSEITGLGTLNCLEAVRRASPKTRFYFAGSSEMFGNATDGSSMLDETSPMWPESPYATAKTFAYHMTRTYRRSYGMHASCGILFNHESPLRGEEFVTRKITMSLARIKHGLQSKVTLGNMDAKRDWGHANDYVKAMYAMLEQPQPDDYVIATGETYSVMTFFVTACSHFGLDPLAVLEIDQSLIRPKDVDVLIGSPQKARKKLKWQPEISFKELVTEMCEYDYL
jgi:GDPmannose 4,6-dehydratase